MLLDRFRVQPAESRKFTIDYSDRLQDGNLLTSINSVAVEPVTSPAFVVTPLVAIGQETVILYTVGGVDGTEYKMTLLVNTVDAGQKWEDEVIFTVEDY